MIFVESKKRKIERIVTAHPGAVILDITSSSPHRYGQVLSPFFPHGNIPIPGDSHGLKAASVEGIWQGLKVFEGADIDMQMFGNDTMKNLKRTVHRFGKPLGHRFGVYSDKILNYADARRYIYIPSYKYVLDNVPEVQNIINRIREKAKDSDIVLLDYNINPDNRDITSPLSHAELVKMYIEGRYPSKDEDFVPFSSEEVAARKTGPVKKTAARKKIESPQDVLVLLPQISELLQTSERSAKEIRDLLSIDCSCQTIKQYLDRIPGIQTRKEKNTVYYTLKENCADPELF